MTPPARNTRLALALALSLGACHRASPPPALAEIPVVSIQHVAEKLARRDRVALFDSNARAQYESAHLPGAVWLPNNEVTPEMLPADKSTPLVFYCSNAL